MAPPARQTKSPGCAETTSPVFAMAFPRLFLGFRTLLEARHIGYAPTRRAFLTLWLCSRAPPQRRGSIKRASLKRRDSCPHQLLDGICRIGAISLASRQAGDALRRDQRVVKRPEKKMAAPDDFGTRNVRQALADRIDEGMAGIVERLRDNPACNLVAFRRHHRAQPGKARSSARE